MRKREKNKANRKQKEKNKANRKQKKKKNQKSPTQNKKKKKPSPYFSKYFDEKNFYDSKLRFPQLFDHIHRFHLSFANFINRRE